MTEPTPGPLVVGPDDRFQIDVLGVDEPLTLYVVGADGRMADATDGIGVYDFSAWDGYGGRPGEGNAIFAGRHDTPNGPGPLFQLKSLQPGESIVVQHAGKTYAYTLVNICDVPLTLTDRVVRTTEHPSLTLITAASQDTRIIAFAELEPDTLPRDCKGGVPAQ